MYILNKMNFKNWLLLIEFSEIKLGENPHTPPNLRPLILTLKYDWFANMFKHDPNPKLKFTVPIKSEKTFDFYHPGKKVYIKFEEEDSHKPFMSKMGVLGIDDKGNTMYWYDAYSAWVHNQPIKLQVEVPLRGEDTKENIINSYKRGFEGMGKKGFKLGDPNEEEIQAHYRGKYDAVHFYPYGTSMPEAKKPDLSSLLINGWDTLVEKAIEKLAHEVIDQIPTTPNLYKFLKYKSTVNEIVQLTSDYVERRVIYEDEKLGIENVKKYITELIPDIIKNTHQQEKLAQQNLQARLAAFKEREPKSSIPTYRGWGRWKSPEDDRLQTIEYLERRQRGFEKRLAVHQKIEAEKDMPGKPKKIAEPRTYDFVKEFDI